jgi:hypothetical protein
MAGAGSLKLYAVVVIAVVIVTIFPSALKIASASAQQLSDDIKPMANNAPVALYIRMVGATPGGMP